MSVTIGKFVELRIIVERDQVELRELGCDLGQGFYFSHPVPEHELAALLRQSRAAHPAQADTAAD